jgi:isochorismate hydrolase
MAQCSLVQTCLGSGECDLPRAVMLFADIQNWLVESLENTWRQTSTAIERRIKLNDKK